MAVVTLEDLHGSIEVTVFPRTYAKTEQVWQEDAVVVVEGKVESRDERTQLICENAEAFEVPDGPAPEPADQPASVAVAPNGSANGNGFHQPGRANGSNGYHANGASGRSANSRAASPKSVPSEAPEEVDRAPEPCSLVLTVRRTGDAPSDIQTLERLHELLPRDGPDLFEIILAQGRRAVRITNPMARTRYSVKVCWCGAGPRRDDQPIPLRRLFLSLFLRRDLFLGRDRRLGGGLELGLGLFHWRRVREAGVGCGGLGQAHGRGACDAALAAHLLEELVAPLALDDLPVATGEWSSTHAETSGSRRRPPAAPCRGPRVARECT
jgi:hypothetical protein